MAGVAGEVLEEEKPAAKRRITGKTSPEQHDLVGAQTFNLAIDDSDGENEVEQKDVKRQFMVSIATLPAKKRIRVTSTCPE